MASVISHTAIDTESTTQDTVHHVFLVSRILGAKLKSASRLTQIIVNGHGITDTATTSRSLNHIGPPSHGDVPAGEGDVSVVLTKSDIANIDRGSTNIDSASGQAIRIRAEIKIVRRRSGHRANRAHTCAVG